MRPALEELERTDGRRVVQAVGLTRQDRWKGNRAMEFNWIRSVPGWITAVAAVCAALVAIQNNRTLAQFRHEAFDVTVPGSLASRIEGASDRQLAGFQGVLWQIDRLHANDNLLIDQSVVNLIQMQASNRWFPPLGLVPTEITPSTRRSGSVAYSVPWGRVGLQLPVYSMIAGEVVEIGRDEVGQRVTVRAADGVTVEHEHLISVVVPLGPVRRGQWLGYVTHSSASCLRVTITGPGGRFIDPSKSPEVIR